MKMKCVEVYEDIYYHEPYDIAFCPYRISPLGAHIDHQYGKINGLAIDKGIHLAYHPKQNGIVEHHSLYNLSIADKSKRLHKILGTIVLMRPIINARFAWYRYLFVFLAVI